MRFAVVSLVLLAGCEAVLPKSDPAEWTESRTVSPVDSAVGLDLSLRSLDGPGVSSDHAPWLSVGCMQDGKLMIYVATHYATGTGMKDVKYRFDARPPVHEEWYFVGGVGAASPPNPRKFLNQLLAAKKLTIQVDVDVGIFDLSQLPKHLPTLKRDCRLKT